ncbi:phytanoyl-CoA dioxygenase family protein [Mesorhizobium sp. VNQ89]|uniref:phytanoyl-CoA dioxygenase family protein n=1 Tax=Mesorhizobium quangtriensis TaxID=3157709 RepID=UPI0032B82754
MASDRTIAVAERHDVEGFGNWNVKNGMNHVEPPEVLLQGMLTLRLHLDDTGADNGALDIVPGSHKLGRVPANKVLGFARAVEAICCEAVAGEILAMRLTTIHKSERSANPTRRRVLHADYSGDKLPPPLTWLL